MKEAKLQGKAAAANDDSIPADLAVSKMGRQIDPALVDLLKDYKARHKLTNDDVGRRMRSNGTYVSRAFTGTFTGDADAFEEAAREMLRNEIEARRESEALMEHGFMVEPMFDFLNSTKHSRSIGVAWSDPGKGKTKALEVYRRKDPLCVVVTATQGLAGWRALRDAILNEIPNKRRMKHENWDSWIKRNFYKTGRLLIIDNAHLLTASCRHWLAYDWHDATDCPVALIGNEEIVQDWKRNAQHKSRVGVAYEVKPRQRPGDTVEHLIKLYLPQAAHDEKVKSLAVQILKGEGACRAVEKHLLIASDLIESSPDRYTPETALRAANNVLLTDVKLAA